MNKCLQNRTKSLLRHLFSIVAVTVVLFSTCSVKNEIKEILGIPIAIEQNGNQRVTLFSTALSDLCANAFNADVSQSPKITLLSSNLVAIVTLSAIVMLLFSVYEIEKRKHPRYNSLKITDSFPIFLLYRKLII
ncbi:hypothetical protein ACRASX_09815 [Flavobacterium sp. TMP13]|uniref:hypothetical protein n=1 Tax=Flavobacterium sp. TMP13 TaxID=3425950 RepID=UPI003D776B57